LNGDLETVGWTRCNGVFPIPVGPRHLLGPKSRAVEDTAWALGGPEKSAAGAAPYAGTSRDRRRFLVQPSRLNVLFSDIEVGCFCSRGNTRKEND